MSTHFHNEPNSDAQRRLAAKLPLSKANRVYFKFLGLQTAESSEEAILEAAKKMATLVQEREPFNPPETIHRFIGTPWWMRGAAHLDDGAHRAGPEHSRLRGARSSGYA